MTELRRLLETTEHDDERAWLLAARDEMPSASGMRDAAIALGLTTVSANALAASVPVAAPALASSGASVAKVVGTASLSALGKSLLGGAVVSFLALTTLDHTLGSSSNSATPLATVTARPAVPSPVVVTPAIEQTPSTPPERDAPRAEVTAARRAAVRSPSPAPDDAPPPASQAPTRAMFAPPAATPAEITSPAASLARETQLLDRARRALSTGDWGQADRTLAAYYAGQPSPVLALEATQLKARLLVARGDRPAAVALARRTIQSHPESAHVLFLQQLANEP